MAREHRTVSRFYFRVKQWKKRLRRFRRPIWSLAAIVLFVAVVAIGIQLSDRVRNMLADYDKPSSIETFALWKDNESKLNESAQLVIAQLVQRDEQREVIARKQYICGKNDEVLGTKPTRDIIQLVLNHPDWSVSMDANGRVILEEQVEELSGTCKDKAHISLDKDGNLTLYDGPPEGGKVIRTFFQLDVESMESSLPPKVMKQLYQGIRITDVDAYHSVLSTFSDYAIEETKKVMKPTHPNERITK
ncbi:BofC C-terminal domain-containing protein [Paenibacillus alvei]|uniref:Bypass of forespore C C-terminal domain-containing protein n=1 Tax=Paenibacillus alvei TaxID=44250 RepID=A0A383R6R6_PAEAL|nr:BofC C-terminal domain-containing protein [Paenibacillus alvei]SYX82262.1 conserved protein of unknown function [Paenibacillus alvei]